MITLDDIKNRVKTIPKNVARKVINKLTYYVNDTFVQPTWIGKIYRCYEQLDGTFKEVEVGSNSVLLGGLENLAYLLYHIPFKVQISRFEDDLWGGYSEVDERPQITYEKDSFPYVQAYNLATDGAQATDILPYPRHKKGYDFTTLIPFRMIPESENDFSLYRNKYMHHATVSVGGKKYIAYYSKKCNISYECLLDNSQPIPQNPDSNLVTDRDSRLIAEFSLNLEEDELVEYFRLVKGSAESTSFSAIMLMIGKLGQWVPKDKPAEHYDTMMETYVMSRANCTVITKGVSSDGTGSDGIIVKYRIMHI